MKKTFSKIIKFLLILSLVSINILPLFSLWPQAQALTASSLPVISSGGNPEPDFGRQVIDSKLWENSPRIGYIPANSADLAVNLLYDLKESNQLYLIASKTGEKIENKANFKSDLQGFKEIYNIITTNTQAAKVYNNNRDNPQGLQKFLPKKLWKLVEEKRAEDKIFKDLVKTAIGGKVFDPILFLRGGEGFDQSSWENPCSAEGVTPDGQPCTPNRSGHNKTVGKANDVYGKDQIKCTLLVCDDRRPPQGPGDGDGQCDENEILQDKKQALQPFDIEFKSISEQKENGQLDKGSAGRNPLSNIISASAKGTKGLAPAFFRSGQENIFRILNSALAGNGKVNDNNTQKLLGSLETSSVLEVSKVLGQAVFNQQLGIEETLPTRETFNDTLNAYGQAQLAKIFKDQLDPQTFKGENFYQWMQSIGQWELEKRFQVPQGSFASNDLLKKTGQRTMEEILGLKSGTLNNSASDYQALTKQIGQGYLEENLFLPAGSFNSDNINEVKKIIGAKKFEDIFSNSAKVSARALLIDQPGLQSGLNNLANFKTTLGEKVLNEKIRVYKDHLIYDEIDKTKEIARLNSQDEMLGLINYQKPEIDFSKNVIRTYNYITGASEEIGFIFASGTNTYTYTYEKILSNLQKENSLTRKFLIGNDLNQVYRAIGANQVAKGLATDFKEQIIMEHFLLTGNIVKETITYNDQVSSQINALDLLDLAERVDLKDWYDLYKLFVDNRANEIIPFYGWEILGLATNISQNERNLLNNDLKADKLDFVLQKLKNLQEQAKKLKDENLQNTIKAYLDSAIALASKEEVPTSANDAFFNPREKKVSGALKNIGSLLKNSGVNETEDAQAIFQAIYEINIARNLPDWSNLDYNNLFPLYKIGLNKSDLENSYFPKDKSKININELNKELAGRLFNTIFDLDEKSSQTAVRIKATGKKSPDEIENELINAIGKDNVTDLAQALNLSLYSQNIEALDIAKIFNGNWTTIVTKILNGPLSEGLGLDKSQSFLQFLQGEISLSENIDEEILYDAGIGEYYFPLIKELLNSSVSLDYSQKILKEGFQFLPNILFKSTVTDIDKYQKAQELLKSYFLDGRNTLQNVFDLRFLNNSQESGTVFHPNVLEILLNKGDLASIIKEVGAINTWQKIKSEFPDSSITLEKLRLSYGLSYPNLEQVNSYISANNSSLSNEELRSIYASLYLSSRKALVAKISQEVQFSYLTSVLRLKDKNLPEKFAQAMFTGQPEEIIQVSRDWIINSLNNPTGSQTQAAQDLDQVLKGEKKAQDLSEATLKALFSNSDFQEAVYQAGYNQDNARTLFDLLSKKSVTTSQSVTIAQNILISNMRKSGAKEEEISQANVLFALISGNTSNSTGLETVISLVSQNSVFSESLAKSGLDSQIINRILAIPAQGNLDPTYTFAIARELLVSSMQNNNMGQEEKNKITAGFDLLSKAVAGGGITSQEGLSTVFNIMAQNEDLKKSLQKSGLDLGTIENLLISATSGNVSSNQAISMTKELIIGNLRSQNTNSKEIEKVAMFFDILQSGNDWQKTSKTVLEFLGQNETFSKDLEKTGLSAELVNNLLSSATSGNFQAQSAIAIVQNLVTKNMEKNLANDAKIKEKIGLVTGAFDLIGVALAGGDSQSLVQKGFYLLAQNEGLRNSLEKAGLSADVVAILFSQASGGGFTAGDIIPVVSHLLTKNMEKNLANDAKIKEKIGLVTGAFDLIGVALAGGSPQSLAQAGVNILLQNNVELQKSLEKAGLSSYAVSNLLGSVLSGKFDQNAAISLVGSVIINKISGAEDKYLAAQIINILSSGGKIDASTLTNLALIKWGDDLDKIFGDLGLGKGSGAAILNILAGAAEGKIDAQGAIMSIAMPLVAEKMTLAMDGLLGSKAGTISAINHEAVRLSNQAADQAKALANAGKDGKIGDKFFGKDFFKNMGISLASSLVAGLIGEQVGQIEQALGLPAGTLANIINYALTSIFTGAAITPVGLAVTVLSAVLPSLLGGGGMVTEIYCAMDYYPFLGDWKNKKQQLYKYRQTSTDQDGNLTISYKDIYYWPGPNKESKVEKGLSQDIEERLGEKLAITGKPAYEFKTKPNQLKAKIKQKMPIAAQLKMNQLIFELLNPAYPEKEGLAPGNLRIPLVAEEAFKKYLYLLDYIYGERKRDPETGVWTEEIDIPAYDLIGKKNFSAAPVQCPFLCNHVHIGSLNP